jgi:hypothetical protein
MRADDGVRRLLNQAIFKALYICDESVTNDTLAKPFAELRTLHQAIQGVQANAAESSLAAFVSAFAGQDAKRPPPTGNGRLWTLVRLATF